MMVTLSYVDRCNCTHLACLQLFPTVINSTKATDRSLVLHLHFINQVESLIGLQVMGKLSKTWMSSWNKWNHVPYTSFLHITSHCFASKLCGAFVSSPPFHLCSETIKTGGSSTHFLHRQSLSGLFKVSACTHLGWSRRAGTACITAAIGPSIVDSFGDIQMSFVVVSGIFGPQF